MSGFSIPAAVPTSFTPTATASTGSLTTTTITGRWVRLANKMLFVSMKAVITDNGTGSGFLRLTLPFTASAATNYAAYFLGRNLNTGAAVVGQVVANGTYIDMCSVANAYPVASGQTINISGTYETV